ncbi:MAG TPA: hypothetical protein VEU33_34830, partial [Archangium sp.]|nr:hypothetical protein [Archangium sp.]
ADTAKNLETACGIVTPLLEPNNNSVGYVSSHLDELIQRYSNLHGNRIGQASLMTYKMRVIRAIRDYLDYKTNPQWQPVARHRRSADERGETEKKPHPAQTPWHQMHPVSPTAQPLAMREESNALLHRLPLRSDFDVELRLPRDFTAKEAKRVTAWITALAGILEPEEPST